MYYVTFPFPLEQGDESLLSITNEARSQTETSLLDFGSLSFGKVPKRLKGARVAESPSVCQSAKRAKRGTRGAGVRGNLMIIKLKK